MLLFILLILCFDMTLLLTLCYDVEHYGTAVKVVDYKFTCCEVQSALAA